MKLIDQAIELVAEGHCNQHRLCAMQRNVTVVANVAGNPFWMATVADANNQHFNGIGKTPASAVELALCYVAIAKQGWG
jgi:hypothetical protein